MEKGSFQKSPFSRDSREFRDSRDYREPPDSGKQRRIRAFSRDSREPRDFRDSRDSSSEKTPFVMTPFSGPDSRRHSAVGWHAPREMDSHQDASKLRKQKSQGIVFEIMMGQSVDMKAVSRLEDEKLSQRLGTVKMRTND